MSRKIEEAILGFLFTVSSMLFWYGGYGIIFTIEIIKHFWWVGVLVAIAFTAGAMWP